MCGGHVWIQWMNHQGHAHGMPVGPRQLGTARACRGRQRSARHLGEIDPGLLEYRAAAEYTAFATTALRPRPMITSEVGAPVELFQRIGNLILQLTQIAAN